jgi:cell division protein FtsW
MVRRTETDKWLFGVTLMLCLLGAVMIFSASAVTAEQQYGHSYYFILRQALWLVVGLAGMFALMKLDYHRLRGPAVVYTAVCGVLLMLVLTFFMDKSHATHRWIRVGPVGMQPSELAKLSAILYLAWFLDLRRREATRLEFCKEDLIRTILPAAAPILVSVGLIVMQPDLGTSVDIVLIMAAVLFATGLSWKWLAAGALAAMPLLFIAITHVSYRLVRIISFWHPESDPQGAGFQLLQSLIAVGSGGFTGVGLMGSTHGFYLCRDLRGARIYRRRSGDCPFCGIRLARNARGVQRAGRIRTAVGAGRDGDGAVSVAHQFCGGGGDDADQRNSAAVCELWGFQSAGDVAGNRCAA